MITVKQARYLLNSFRLCSKLYRLPLKIHPHAGKISTETSGASRRTWWLMLHALSVRGIYSICFVLKMCVQPSSFSIQSFTIHVLPTMVAFDGLLIAHDIFREHSDCIVVLFNSLLFRDGYVHKQRFTVQDLVVLLITSHFPAAQILYGIHVILICGHLEYPLPTAVCGPACSVALVFIAEFIMSSVLLVPIAFCAITVILFLQNCEYWLRTRCQNFEARIQRGCKITELAEAYKDLRVFQLYLQLFNSIFYRHSFFMKNGSAVVAVTTISCGILIVRQHPFQAILMLVIALWTIVTFPVIFEDGSRIPVHVQKLKKKLKATCQNRHVSPYWTLGNRRHYLKSIRSIPNLGIKIGFFHQLERLSTPLSIGLIVSCVIKILFAFK